MKMTPKIEMPTINVDMIGLEEHYITQIRELTLAEAAYKAGDWKTTLWHFGMAWDAIDGTEEQYKHVMSGGVFSKDSDPPMQAFWGATGEYPKSLFAYLPDCGQCLTQARDIFSSHRVILEPEVIKYQGIVERYDIPAHPGDLVVGELVNFARAQIEALAI